MTTPRNERIDAYVKAEKKNPIMGLLIVVLLGPLGYLYISPLSGVIAILLAIALAAVSFTLVIPLWLICIVAAPFEINSQNYKIRKKAELLISD